MKKLLAGSMMVSVMFGTSVSAGGLSTSGQGARALSMGGAFTGVADDGSAIYYNPAGINQIGGTLVEGGINLIYPKIEYEIPNGAVEKSTKNAYGPSFFVTHRYTDKLSVGFGIYSPYARDSKYSDDLINRFPSQRATIVRIDFSPVISYQFNDNFSVGGGLIIGYNKIDQSIPAGPTLRIEDKANGFGYGGIIGFLWKVNEQIKIGATYRSRMNIDSDGDRTIIDNGMAIKGNASTECHFPSSASLGIGYMPNEKLTLAMDINWYEWSYMDKFVTTMDLGPTSTIYTDNDNSWDIRFGGEYKLDQGWAARAGYAYSQGATPNTHILPTKPDANGHEFDLGIGKTYDKFKIDLVCEYIVTNKEEASANIYQYNGKYDIAEALVGLTVSYTF